MWYVPLSHLFHKRPMQKPQYREEETMKVSVRKGRRMSLISSAITLSAIAVFLWSVTGCQKGKQPIKVGFVGGLIGDHSDLGTSGQNGVMLATEEINRAGGIGGRPVELIVKDDMSYPETALMVDKQLIEEGVVAIIGHMTSAMSIVAVPMINEQKVHMISPTTTTNKLSRLDDHFFRIQPSSKELIQNFSNFAFETMGLRKMVVVHDVSNKAYTQEWYDFSKSEFEKHGGSLTAEGFAPGSHLNLPRLVDRILEVRPDGVLLVASPEASASLCSQLRRLSSEVRILSSPWAMSGDFVKDAGIAAEGVILTDSFDKHSQAVGFADFRKRFKNRFGVDPNRASMSGYEAAKILFTALSTNSDPAMLGETIVRLRTFEGLQGPITIDEYGDAHRKLYLITVQGGEFVTLGQK
jgi:branched-chain amino acid transport system substrate-binding protein